MIPGITTPGIEYIEPLTSGEEALKACGYIFEKIGKYPHNICILFQHESCAGEFVEFNKLSYENEYKAEVWFMDDIDGAEPSRIDADLAKAIYMMLEDLNNDEVQNES